MAKAQLHPVSKQFVQANNFVSFNVAALLWWSFVAGALASAALDVVADVADRGSDHSCSASHYSDSGFGIDFRLQSDSLVGSSPAAELRGSSGFH
jgi:hypothetical protein